MPGGLDGLVNALSEYGIWVGEGCDHAQNPVAGVLISVWRARGNDNAHISEHRDGLTSNSHYRLAGNNGNDLLVFGVWSGTTSPGLWNIVHTDIERAPTSRLTTIDNDGCPEVE
jgi:hypothetical protein